jgi:hypothetical protein
MAFFAGLLLVVQLPMLRMAWDLFRNLLALIFLFPAIYFLETNHKTKNLILLVVFSLLIILSNQLVAGLWFVIVFGWLLKNLFKKKFREALKIFLSIIPAVLMFIITIKTVAGNTFGGQVIYEGEPDRFFYFEIYRNQIPYQELTTIIFNLFKFNTLSFQCQNNFYFFMLETVAR